MKKIFTLIFLFWGVTQSLQAQCLATTTPTNDGTDGDAIDTFTLAGVASAGNYGTPANGYNSFSTPVRTLAIGGTYNWAADVGGMYGYEEGFAIWIDLNNDGIYANSEQLAASPTYDIFHQGNLTIPYSATIANNVHMRVRCAYYTTIANNEACLDDIGGYGETEDYLVNIVCPPAPNLTVVASSTFICVGESITLTADGGGQTYTWSGPMSVTNGTAFAPTSSGSYTVTSTVNGCPSSSATAVRVISVTSTPLSISASAGSALACSNNTIQLTATGASNFTWMPGGWTGATVIATPSVNITYSIVGYNGTGCPGVTTLPLSVTPSPTLNIATSATAVCPGQPVTFTVTGATTYTWANSSNSSTITLSPTSPTNVMVSGTSQNCSSSTSQLIVINPAPSLTLSAAKPIICIGASNTLIASGSSDNYSWNSGPAAASGNTVVSPSSTSVYTVVGTSNTLACNHTQTIEVIVYDPEVPINASTGTVCPGSVVTLTASASAAGYTWAPSASLFSVTSVTVSVPSTFSLTVKSSTTGGLSCHGTSTIHIDTYTAANVSATANRTVMCRGENNTLSGTGALTYTWTGITTPTANLNISPNIGVYTYTVTGTDANGCKDNGTVTIKVNGCAGIASIDADNDGVSVYPNPNDGHFVLESSIDSDLQIVNELGQIVRSVAVNKNQGTQQVHISDLPKGIYFVIGQKDGIRINKKIVVTE